MMSLSRNASLQSLHTFCTEVRAAAVGTFHSAQELQELLALPEFNDQPELILGGGSNVLFLRDFDGLVLLNRLGGITKIDEDSQHVLVKAGAGVGWHELVQYTVDQGWGGIENLSLIPGLCGAAPMQNIGAYGVELKDVFVELEALHKSSGTVKIIDREACQFGYRESIFKRKDSGQYVILSITLRLSKSPELKLAYGAIANTLTEMGIDKPTITDVSQAVIQIRRSKLPDPVKIGNAGSFFKNPELSAVEFNALLERNPDLPSYPQADGRIKVPAGWLIEQAGWKGRRIGAAGCHAQQALVLVNYGGAKGEDIWQLAQAILADVQEKFGVALQPEVNLIG